MTNTETISIDQELWEDAKKAYENVSGKISDLIQDDLDQNPDQQRPVDIVKNSSLTDRQKQVAKEMIKQGFTEKSGTQMSSFLEAKGFDRTDYRKKFKNAIKMDEDLPFKDGDDRGGIQASDYVCDCGASMNPTLLSKNDGFCMKCEKRLVDFGGNEK